MLFDPYSMQITILVHAFETVISDYTTDVMEHYQSKVCNQTSLSGLYNDSKSHIKYFDGNLPGNKSLINFTRSLLSVEFRNNVQLSKILLNSHR